MHYAIYLAPSLFRQGEIHEALGDRARAADHYRRFLALWKDADPELRPKVEEARRRLAGLSAEARH